MHKYGQKGLLQKCLSCPRLLTYQNCLSERGEVAHLGSCTVNLGLGQTHCHHHAAICILSGGFNTPQPTAGGAGDPAAAC